jgi:hypothetical protein
MRENLDLIEMFLQKSLMALLVTTVFEFSRF